MADKAATPTVEDSLAALAKLKKATAVASLEPLKALLAQGETLSLPTLVQVTNTLIPMVEDPQHKLALTNASNFLPGYLDVLRGALDKAEKAVSA